MAPSSTSHCANPGIRRGAWSKEEDVLLRRCVEKYGEGKWHLLPSRAGLRRCRKSCRLRWLNYLSPNIKRGSFAPDEDDLIIRMQRILGNRWSLIAGRIIGRTANDIKNRWNSHLCKKTVADRPPKESPPVPSFVVVKPQAHRLTAKAPYWIKAKAQAGDVQPAGNFPGEQFCFSGWFDPKSNTPGGGEVAAPHQTRAESSLLSEILLDLDGIEFPTQAMTTGPIEAELEWKNLLSDPDLDGIEFPTQAMTTVPIEAELEWQNLLSDPDFWSLQDIDGGATFEPTGKQAPSSDLPKS